MIPLRRSNLSFRNDIRDGGRLVDVSATGLASAGYNVDCHLSSSLCQMWWGGSAADFDGDGLTDVVIATTGDRENLDDLADTATE